MLLEQTKMSCDYSIDKERRLVLVTAWGELTAKTVRDYRDRLIHDPAFEPTFHQLVDFTKVTHVTLDAADIRALAAPPIFARGSKRAFVVSSDEMFGLARMFEIHRQMRGAQEILQVFRDKDVAVRWLFPGDETFLGKGGEE
jgi:hypothetical protein